MYTGKFMNTKIEHKILLNWRMSVWVINMNNEKSSDSEMYTILKSLLHKGK